MPSEAVDLVSRLLQYSPNLRSTAVSVILYFGDLGLSLGNFGPLIITVI